MFLRSAIRKRNSHGGTPGRTGRERGHTTRAAEARNGRARGSFVRGTVSGTAPSATTILLVAPGARLNARLPQCR